jgi:hypothetical protein
MRRMRRSRCHRRTDHHHHHCDCCQPAGGGVLFTIMRIADADGEIWRLTTASGSLACDLRLIDFASKKPMVTQLLSIDDCTDEQWRGGPCASPPIVP